MVNNLVYLICNMLVIFSLHIFCTKMFPDSNVSLFRIISAVIYMIIDGLVYFFTDSQVGFVITSVILYFLFSFAYSVRINYKNFIVTLVFLVFGICSELISSFIVSFSQPLFRNVDVSSEIAATTILSRIIFFLLILIAMRFVKFQNKEDFADKYIWFTLVIPALSIWLILYIFSLTSFNQKTIHDSGSIGAVVAVTSIIAMNVLAFFIFDRLHKLCLIEKEDARLKQTIIAQQVHYAEEKLVRENIRKIKHDYKNMLIAIKSDIQSEKNNEAISLIDKELGNVNSSQISNSNNLAVDSIITYKSSIAAEKNIRIVPEFRMEEILNIDSRDICVLIGNALDNAIEYLEAHPVCKQVIHIRIVFSKGIFDIKVTNEVSEKIIINNNFIPSSKKEDGHGYGLKSVRCIAEKYGGVMLLVCTDKQFELGVVMNC